MDLPIFRRIPSIWKVLVNKLRIIIDTGPLIAFLNADDYHHPWILDCFKKYPGPFITCDSVLTEAFYVLKRRPHGTKRFFDLIGRDFLKTAFDILKEHKSLEHLTAKYKDVPMSLTDACLVRMAEIVPNSAILTLDSDFCIYRKHRRQIIPLILPS